MSSAHLRRYTDLTALIYLLRKRRLTLLDPSSWDNSNDSYYLTLYKEKRKLNSVLALCFTESDERCHYWLVFAPSASGVCMRFNRSGLLAAVGKQRGLQVKPVSYLTLDDMRSKKLKTAELPFLKRFAFQHESEVRMIYESATKRHRQNHLESVDTPKSVFVCEGNKAFIDILRVWPEDIFIWERCRAPTELYRLGVRGRWRP
jgi:hypothetical protein